LARRAKSYSDFYEVAMEYLQKDAMRSKSNDVLDTIEFKKEKISYGLQFEELEDNLLDASHEEYQYAIPLISRGKY
jgi:hypothetical protein